MPPLRHLAFAAVFMAATPGFAQEDRNAAAATLPIADVHFHLVLFMTPAQPTMSTPGGSTTTPLAIRQGVLAQLKPQTAEMVAWRNAARLFRLPEVQ